MDPYLGEIRLFAGDYAPADWRLCDGTLLAISDNEALYNILGTTYGGDGRNTFGLPKLVGRVAVGAGQGVGLSSYSLGQTGGQDSVALTPAQGPAHTHNVMASTKTGTSLDPDGAVFAMPPAPAVAYLNNPASLEPLDLQSVRLSEGASVAHDNLMPTLLATYIIAVKGIWPSN